MASRDDLESGKFDADGQLRVGVGHVDLGALVTLTNAATGGQTADQTNGRARGIKVVVDVTAISGTSPTLTVTIQGKDTASGKYYTLLASAALSVVGTTVLTVYPALGSTTNVVANDVLPRVWRVSYVVGGTTPAITATLGVCLLG